MCEQARLVLPPALPSAATARQFAAARCHQWGLPALSDDLVLSLSEVVTNAVVHTGSPATVTISLAGEYLEAAVSDDSPRAPIVRPPRLDLLADIEALRDRDGLQVGPAGSIAGGRGMLIVDAIADEWGVAARSGGKEVWFRLRTPGGTAPSCKCLGSSVLTPGGLPLHT